MLTSFNRKPFFEKEQILADDESWSKFMAGINILDRNSKENSSKEKFKIIFKIYHELESIHQVILMQSLCFSEDNNQLEAVILNTIYDSYCNWKKSKLIIIYFITQILLNFS
jgi:hypothetical protein